MTRARKVGDPAVTNQTTGVGTGEGEFGANQWLVEELYQQFKSDRNAVDKEWWPVLEAYEASAAPAADAAAPAAAPAQPAQAAPAPEPEPAAEDREGNQRACENILTDAKRLMGALP